MASDLANAELTYEPVIFALGGNRRVRDPLPGTGHAAYAAVGVQVRAERRGVDQKTLVHVVQANADDFGRDEQQRTNVRIGTSVVAAQHVHRELGQLVVGVGQVQAQDARRTAQAGVVLLRLQDVQLGLIGVPVGADAFETAGAVVQRMGHRPDVDVVVANYLAVKEHPTIGVARPRPYAWGKLCLHLIPPLASYASVTC